MSNTKTAQTPIISVRDGGYEGFHNYYYRPDYFRTEWHKGAHYVKDGQRALMASEEFIVGLMGGYEQDVGEASGLLMYKAGYQWALADMKRFNDRMRHEFGGGKNDIWQMNEKFVFECWWWPLNTTGWGAWSLDLQMADKDLTFVVIKNSAVASSMEQAGRPVCNLYAGLFAGAISFFKRVDREAIEIQCYAMGNDCCKFMVGPQKKVNAAEFWRREGASAEEIRERL